MAKVSKYEVEISGIKHVLQLTAEDAENIPGAKLVSEKSSTPANKSGSASNKAS